MKTSRILFAALLVLLSGVVYGQDIKVTGSVLDASDGTAVPYASVHVKGTMRGVSADDQGHFSISAPGDGVLVFTCIGYGQYLAGPLSQDSRHRSGRAQDVQGHYGRI